MWGSVSGWVGGRRYVGRGLWNMKKCWGRWGRCEERCIEVQGEVLVEVLFGCEEVCWSVGKV